MEPTAIGGRRSALVEIALGSWRHNGSVGVSGSGLFLHILADKALGVIELISVAFQKAGYDFNLVVDLAPLPLLDGFTDPGQGLDGVAGVKARSVNHVAVPRALGQSFVARQKPFHPHEDL